jgi:predicted nucleic acid-binding protein
MMVLVDTSVWVDHLQRSNAELVTLLNRGQVLAHPFVIGELALGSLKQRNTILEALQNLPACTTATDAEVFSFINANALHGIGIGYVDAHLLAATRLTPTAKLWTLDKRLQAAATRLGLSFTLSL